MLPALACFAFAPPIVAEPANWLVIEGPCPASAAEVARRVDAELIGSRPTGARARVSIDAVTAGYGVTLQAARAGKDLGGKHLVAPSCDEAVDAAVLVLAIALTEPEPEVSEVLEVLEVPEVPVEEGRTASSEARSPSSELAFVVPSGTPQHDEPVSTEDESAASHGPRAGVLFGIETGIAPQPTPYLGASFALPFDSWELWSAVRYGLPTEEASVEASTSEELRRDFGAIGLSLCRGVGAAWRFSLCAGGEFGVRRVDHTRRDDSVEVDSHEDRARLAAVGAARFSGRVGSVRPELDFSAAAASWGPGAPPELSLRLGAGVAVQF